MTLKGINQTRLACCIGVAAWDRTLEIPLFPAPGDEVRGRLVAQGAGGKTANTAATMALLGISTTLVCRLGADVCGRRIRTAVQEIATLTLQAQRATVTQEADILVTPDAQRTIVTYAGTSAEPEPTARARAAMRHAGMCWVNIRDPERRLAFRGAVHGEGIGIPLEHLSEESCRGSTWPIVIGSGSDSGVPDSCLLEEAAVKICVVTEGGQGGKFWTPRNGWTRYQAGAVAHVVDTCGAGDAFVGGFLAGLVSGRPPEEAVLAGATAATHVVGRFGAWPSPMPSAAASSGQL